MDGGETERVQVVEGIDTGLRPNWLQHHKEVAPRRIARGLSRPGRGGAFKKSRTKYGLKRIYLFHAFRCAAAQSGVETNHPEFVGLGTMVT